MLVVPSFTFTYYRGLPCLCRRLTRLFTPQFRTRYPFDYFTYYKVYIGHQHTDVKRPELLCTFRCGDGGPYDDS